jgi:hypothetical protein
MGNRGEAAVVILDCEMQVGHRPCVRFGLSEPAPTWPPTQKRESMCSPRSTVQYECTAHPMYIRALPRRRRDSGNITDNLRLWNNGPCGR